MTTLTLSTFIIFGAYLLMNPEIRVKTEFCEIDGVTLPGLILVGVFGFLLLRFLRRVFILRIDKDQLDILTLGGRHILHRTDIQFIDLRGRQTVFGQAADVVTIDTVYGKTLILSERLCRNMPRIKEMLTQWYGELIINAPTVEPGKRPKYAGETEIFRGNLLNIHGLIFLGTFLFFGWLCINLVKDPGWQSLWELMLLFIVGVFTWMMGSELCYFTIAQEQLIIRNHVFPWYRKVYDLEDISGVVFAFASKRAFSLRIRTTDQRSHNYRAGSLRRTNWKALEKAFRKRRISVHNELPGL